MPSAKSLLLIIFAAAILATDVVALLLVKEPLSHPYLVVETDQDVRLIILQHGTKSESTCEAEKSSYANALLLGCPTCRVSRAECAKGLTPEQQTLLSSSPLNTYSASIPNGVVNFTARNLEVAAAVCYESAKPKNGNNSNVTCFAPRTNRPELASSRAGAGLQLNFGPIIWICASILLLCAWPLFYGQINAGTISSNLVALSRRQKQLLIAWIDFLIVGVTLWLAFVFRLDTLYVPTESTQWLFLLAPLIAILVFRNYGLYQSVIRYLGLQAMIQLAKAVVVYVVILAILSFLLPQAGVPRSVIPIHGALALLAIGATRGLARIWLTKANIDLHGTHKRKSVAIYGAGAAGMQLANALAHSRELLPVAFLDDDKRLHRNRLGELEVFAPQQLHELIARFGVTEVLLAIPSAPRQRRSEIIDLLEALPVQVRTLPALSDLAEGKIKTDDLREVDIDDLLGRDAVLPDTHLLKAKITGKSIMVTGAGGSIGSELCRQIVSLQPNCLVLFEQNEFALYKIEHELSTRIREDGKDQKQRVLIPVIGSVTDQSRMERIIRHYRVNTVYHAAAYKHVPMVEHNPCEGVVNNAIGTYRAARAAISGNVETFVLISTDKAVRPTNTMGATKRLAELILQALAEDENGNHAHTNFSAVRFGNVLGSSGSVVPLFRDQILKGGPITVTDPRIIRYFMTISEAAELVLQAGAMGRNGDVFVLDMGEPVKILDLAHRMIRLSGLQIRDVNTPTGDIEIIFTGLRPGEKLYEELLTGDNPSKTQHPRIMRASENKLPHDVLVESLSKLENAAIRGDSDAIRMHLMAAVEDFRPQCGNEDLVKP